MKEMLGQHRAVNVIFYNKEKQQGFHRWWQVLAEHICHEGQFKQSIQMEIKERQKWSNTQTQCSARVLASPGTDHPPWWKLTELWLLMMLEWILCQGLSALIQPKFMNSENTHTLLILRIKQITSENLLHSTGSSMHWDELSGKKIQKGGHVCICMVDSFSCTVGKNTIF